jgi:hypothetical protein
VFCVTDLTMTDAVATSVRHIALLLLPLLLKYGVLRMHSGVVTILITVLTVMSDVRT